MNKLIECDEHKGACVNSQLGFIFVGTPKTASSSIRSLMGEYNANYLDLRGNDSLEGKVVFTVIRNPLLRFISGYLEVLSYLVRQKSEYRHFYFYGCLLEIADEKHRLERFVELCEQMLPDVHVMTQKYFLTDNEGQLFNFDEILLFENLEDEFDRFCLRHGRSFKLGFKNRKTNMATNKCLSILKGDLNLTHRINFLYRDDWNLYGDVLLKRFQDINNPITEKLAARCDKSWVKDIIVYQFEKMREKNPLMHSFLRFWVRRIRFLINFFRYRA